MKTLFFMIGILLSITAQAQEKPVFKPHFVNMTEFGGLFGRVVYNTNMWNGLSESVDSRLSFTLQTFNGVQLKPRLAVGGTVGIDWYKTTLILPIAAGIRYDLAKSSSKKSTFYASLDAGYGFNWLNVNASGYATSGGMMLNPGIGLKIGLKSQSALLISLSYKQQNLTVTKPINTGEIEKYEDRVYNRMAFRIGVSF